MLKNIYKNNLINLEGVKHLFLVYIKKFFKINLTFALLFTIYFLIKPTVYISKVSFYTNYNEAPQSSFLSMLPAGMLGGGLGYTSLSFSIQNFLSSERFLNEIVNSQYQINNSTNTLVNQWGSDYNNFFTLNPVTFLKRLNFNIGFNKGLTDSDKKEIYAMSILKNSINFSEDRRTLLNTISVKIKSDSKLGEQIINNIYESIISYSSDVVNIKATEKKQFISNRLEELTESLFEAEEAMLKFSQENKQIQNSPLLTLERQRLQKDITLYNQLFFTLSDQYELAKINEKDNTTSFFILEMPTTSRTKQDGSFIFVILKNILFLNLFIIIFFIYHNRQQLFEL